MGLVEGQEQVEAGAQFVHFHQWRQRLGQGGQVPMGDRYLVAEGVAAGVVGVVADVIGVEIVEEGVGPVVEGNAEDRHVVGVHHPVAEAIGLPAGDEFGVALDDLAEHRRVWPLGCVAVGEVVFQNERRQLFQLVVLAGVVEVFEVTEAHVAGRQAQQRRRAFLLLAPDRRARTDHAERPAAGNAQCRKGFEARNSRIDERSTARPSPIRE